MIEPITSEAMREAYRAAYIPGLEQLEDVIARAAKRHGVSPLKILEVCRFPEVVCARWDVIAELYDDGWSMSRIARALSIDPSSVRNALCTRGKR